MSWCSFTEGGFQTNDSVNKITLHDEESADCIVLHLVLYWVVLHSVTVGLCCIALDCVA